MSILERFKKIFKDPIPKGFQPYKFTLDWYVKWIASIFVILAMSLRGVSELVFYDMLFTLIGLILWLWVSIIWRDRALIILNAVGFILVLRNFVEYLLVQGSAEAWCLWRCVFRCVFGSVAYLILKLWRRTCSIYGNRVLY